MAMHPSRMIGGCPRIEHIQTVPHLTPILGLQESLMTLVTYCTSYYLVQRIWPTTSKGAASVVHFQKIVIHATSQNKDVGHMHSDIQELNNAID